MDADRFDKVDGQCADDHISRLDDGRVEVSKLPIYRKPLLSGPVLGAGMAGYEVGSHLVLKIP